MDSLNTLLSEKHFEEPDEVIKLKHFIKDEYNVQAVISVNGNSLIINVKSSPLASSLRLRLPEIKKSLGITKPIRLRIN